jgi:hypothetical protein
VKVISHLPPVPAIPLGGDPWAVTLSRVRLIPNVLSQKALWAVSSGFPTVGIFLKMAAMSRFDRIEDATAFLQDWAEVRGTSKFGVDSLRPRVSSLSVPKI